MAEEAVPSSWARCLIWRARGDAGGRASSSTFDWTGMLYACVTWTGQNLIICEYCAIVPFFMEMGPDYNQFAW